jgi:hypothetical protein
MKRRDRQYATDKLRQFVGCFYSARQIYQGKWAPELVNSNECMWELLRMATECWADRESIQRRAT